MEKEELFRKRIQELARQADQRGCVTFTDFLDLNEQNILHQSIQKFSWIQGETFGGYEGAERKMAAFIPEDIHDRTFLQAGRLAYPIVCIRIEPASLRFAEKLSHRDILGALMNLGIERSRTGDIAVGEKESFLFCHELLARTVCEELTKIRHTTVHCSTCDPENFTYEPQLQPIRGSVASVRLDALISVAFQASRSSLISLIEAGAVFVNGKLIMTNSYAPVPGDIISVRGHGRFRFCGTSGTTKKGRCIVEVEKFI